MRSARGVINILRKSLFRMGVADTSPRELAAAGAVAPAGASGSASSSAILFGGAVFTDLNCEVHSALLFYCEAHSRTVEGLRPSADNLVSSTASYRVSNLPT